MDGFPVLVEHRDVELGDIDAGAEDGLLGRGRALPLACVEGDDAGEAAGHARSDQTHCSPSEEDAGIIPPSFPRLVGRRRPRPRAPPDRRSAGLVRSHVHWRPHRTMTGRVRRILRSLRRFGWGGTTKIWLARRRQPDRSGTLTLRSGPAQRPFQFRPGTSDAAVIIDVLIDDDTRACAAWPTSTSSWTPARGRRASGLSRAGACAWLDCVRVDCNRAARRGRSGGVRGGGGLVGGARHPRAGRDEFLGSGHRSADRCLRLDLGFAIVVGAVFGVLASACAFVISFGGYHDQFMDTRKPWQLALQSAMTAFIVFFLLAGVATWAFRWAVSQ